MVTKSISLAILALVVSLSSNADTITQTFSTTVSDGDTVLDGYFAGSYGTGSFTYDPDNISDLSVSGESCSSCISAETGLEISLTIFGQNFTELDSDAFGIFPYLKFDGPGIDATPIALEFLIQETNIFFPDDGDDGLNLVDITEEGVIGILISGLSIGSGGFDFDATSHVKGCAPDPITQTFFTTISYGEFAGSYGTGSFTYAPHAIRDLSVSGESCSSCISAENGLEISLNIFGQNFTELDSDAFGIFPYLQFDGDDCDATPIALDLLIQETNIFFPEDGDVGLNLIDITEEGVIGIWIKELSIVSGGVNGPGSFDFEATSYVNGAVSADIDEDGIEEAADNCQLVANADQRDTNGDGYGNACDPDINNDGIVNFADLALWFPFFNTTNNGDEDFNGDGNANFADYALFPAYFLQPPGPSGVVP